jgi:hypothetical protein
MYGTMGCPELPSCSGVLPVPGHVSTEDEYNFAYKCRSGTEEEYAELEQLLEDIATYVRDMAEPKANQQKVASLKKSEDKRKGEETRKAAMEGITSWFA